MIFPIFIQMRSWDDDCDRDKHGYDCECSKCKEKKKYDSMPRNYYDQWYAIPKSWKYKRIFRQSVKLSLMLIGVAFAISYIVDRTWLFPDVFGWPMLVHIIGGMLMVVVPIVALDKWTSATYTWRCPDSITLKVYTGYGKNKTLEEVKKEKNVPEDYILTDFKNSWEYA